MRRVTLFVAIRDGMHLKREQHQLQSQHQGSCSNATKHQKQQSQNTMTVLAAKYVPFTQAVHEHMRRRMYVSTRGGVKASGKVLTERSQAISGEYFSVSQNHNKQRSSPRFLMPVDAAIPGLYLYIGYKLKM